MPAAPAPVGVALGEATADVEAVNAFNYPKDLQKPAVEEGTAPILTAAEATAEPAAELNIMPVTGMDASSRSGDLSGDDVQHSNAAEDVAACSVEGQPSHEDKASQPKREFRRGRRLNPKAKALAELELVGGDVQKALERVRMQLRKDAASVDDCSAQRVAATAAMETASQALGSLGADVQAVMDVESLAGDRVKMVQKRLREAKETLEENKAKLQSCQEVLVIVELKASTHDAKRQKLAELEKAVADCAKAQEEIRKQEREAKEAMRHFMKENKHMSKLGAFGRRHRDKMQAATHAAEVHEMETVTATAERANDGQEALPQPFLPAVVSADQIGDDRPVRIKREAMQAFCRPQDPAPLEPIVIIDED